MKLDIAEITKLVLFDKKVAIENVDVDKIRISYKNIGYRTSNHMISPILPKFVILDTRFAEAVGMYLGDGTNSKKSEYSVQYVSKDHDICKFILEFFINVFHVNIDDIDLSINYKFENTEMLGKSWSSLLGVPASKFRFYRKTKNYKNSTVCIGINGVIFRRVFQYITENYLDIIIENTELRRAFLRGYFAAEGSISTYANSTGKIQSINFSYNAEKERLIRDFCTRCLKKENITYDIREDGRKGTIVILNWSNSQKLWQIKIFDRCVRKKNSFLKAIEGLIVYVTLRDDFRYELLKLFKTQQNIADFIGSTQGNVSEMIKGRRPIEIKQLKNLCSHSGIDLKDAKNNITSLKVYHERPIECSEEFLDILL